MTINQDSLVWPAQGSIEALGKLSVVKLGKEKAVGDNIPFFIPSMSHRNSSALSLC